ncbi:hypothetical protein B0T18DRAFT_155310 [Schizothecium vesticola]|uniref:Uncharacterized protein n=1 Tax=Schizothecium vesticola TaxID=314040 RepID=A0AA40K5E1_9PEZI|nr:hypothetical protein B0T18DRAFT_155310 [Schizothecium vesticola]
MSLMFLQLKSDLGRWPYFYGKTSRAKSMYKGMVKILSWALDDPCCLICPVVYNAAHHFPCRHIRSRPRRPGGLLITRWHSSSKSAVGYSSSGGRYVACAGSKADNLHLPPRLLPSWPLQPLQALNRGDIMRMPRFNDGEILQRGSHPLRWTGAQCRRDVHHCAALLRPHGNGDWRRRSSRRLRVRLPGRPQDVCGYLVHQGG